MHKHLMFFNPDVMSLEQSHQDFHLKWDALTQEKVMRILMIL